MHMVCKVKEAVVKKFAAISVELFRHIPEAEKMYFCLLRLDPKKV